jgi:hypothetical protein
MAKRKIIEQPIEEQKNGWNTLHIFGYGETQLNGSIGKKVETSSLTKVQAVIDYIYSLKPEDVTAGNDYHAITIIKGVFARFTPKNSEEKSFSVEYKNIDTTTINELVLELESLA